VATFATDKRPGSYTRRDEEEQRAYFDRMSDDPRTREHELLAMMLGLPEQLKASVPYVSTISVRVLLRALLYRLEHPVLLRLGVDPVDFYAWRARRRKGASLTRIRRLRGLDPSPAPERSDGWPR
jgi:hypothetical protein